MDSFLSLEANSLNIVGIVKAYNESTREVAVFIPKFMPIVPEDRQDIDEMTNYGNNNITSTLDYNTQITKTSYIWAMAKNADEKLPKVGSRVLLTFMEGNIDSLYWEPFNPNGDYEVIDNEKYDKLISLKVGEKQKDISEEDSIKITLPEDFDCVMLKDDAKKEVTFKINYSNASTQSIQRLRDIIGNTSYITTVNGELKTVEATGLISRIETIESVIGNESTATNLTKLELNDGDSIPANTYILADDKYTEVTEGSIYDSTNEYYQVTYSAPSGILEALTLVDNALGYPTSGKENSNSITTRVENLEDKIPTPPTTAGTYTLQCAVGTDGSIAYSWK